MSIILDGTAGLQNNATDLSYTGTLTGGTGVVNLGSGQVYKDASGNVGIGTSSPNAKLDVVSPNQAIGSGVTTFGNFNVGATNAVAADNGGSITFSALGNGAQYYAFGKVSGRKTNASAGDTRGYLAFEVGNGSANMAEAARIDSSGNLLVGCTVAPFGSSPGVALRKEVDGGFLQTGANTTSSRASAIFYNPNGVVGTIATSGGATAYNTSSDYRLKDTIAPMTGALDKVALLKPCTYKWNADGSDGQGFIAHELAEVEPGCVTGTKDAVDAEGKPQYQGIDTSFLVATLTAAIQELKAIIDTQATRITALEAK